MTEWQITNNYMQIAYNSGMTNWCYSKVRKMGLTKLHLKRASILHLLYQMHELASMCLLETHYWNKLSLSSDLASNFNLFGFESDAMFWSWSFNSICNDEWLLLEQSTALPKRETYLNLHIFKNKKNHNSRNFTADTTILLTDMEYCWI